MHLLYNYFEFIEQQPYPPDLNEGSWSFVLCLEQYGDRTSNNIFSI